MSIQTSRMLHERASLERLLSASGDAAYCWDLASDEIRWLGALTDVFGRDGGMPPPAAGADFQVRLHPEDLPVRRSALAEHLACGHGYECEFRIRRTDGEYIWVQERGAAELMPLEKPSRFLAVLRPIGESKRAEAALKRHMSIDELTELPNRNYLHEALDLAILRARQTERSGAFLVFGLDQLALVNTAFGYGIGDVVLKEVAKRLETLLNEGEIVGRLGGDRFGIIATRCNQEEALHRAEVLLDHMSHYSIEVGEQTALRAAGSVGIAAFPSSDANAQDILAAAEGALGAAKAKGRNSVAVASKSESERSQTRERLGIGEQVSRALREGQLCFAYQPVVDAKSKKAVFHECLLRMRRPDGEIIAASRFVPVVEQLGLTRSIDRYVLGLALEDLRAYPDVTLSINISGFTTVEPSWLRDLKRGVQSRPDIAARLIIEITETTALVESDETRLFLDQVRSLGCRIAVDDFGAGFTTYRHLRSLDFDIVKIDGSFVRGAHASRQSQVFLHNLVNLAKCLDLPIVAEGVETVEDAAYLVGEGVDLMQGYYLARPTLEPAWKAATSTDRDKAARLAG